MSAEKPIRPKGAHKATLEGRLRVQTRVAEILADSGATLDLSVLRDEFPDIPYESFYRWARQARARPPDQKLISKIKRRIKKRAAEAGLPVPADGISHVLARAQEPMQAIDVLFEVAKSLKGADDVEKRGRNKKGEVTMLGADLVLGAANARTKAVGILAKIQLEVLEAERLRAYHADVFRVILTRLAGADRALALLVAEDIRAVNKRWGMEFRV